MIDSEESCVYCSKCLVGLNDFNKKMHIETCKVRKLVDANRNNSENQLEDFIVLGDNCTYCFKSFKDFKSDFNKRIHIKCCKIKKETYEQKNNMKMLARANGATSSNNNSSSAHTGHSAANSATNTTNANSNEHCIFCTKPLANLNEFNKRMHIENCKIRKSIENNGVSTKHKDDTLIKIGLELGDSCMYCSKSFVNLSDFNKKLHFEYCKLKKKKLNSQQSGAHSSSGQSSFTNPTGGASASSSSSSSSSSTSSSHTNTTLNLLSASNNQLMHLSSSAHSLLHDDSSSKIAKLDLGETCLFCSRSLQNLSNFNKRIHIETCKVKTLKKASKKLKQTTNTSFNRSRKKANKKMEIPNSNNASLAYCQNMNKNLTLDLMGATSAALDQQVKQFSIIQSVVDPNNNDPNSLNLTLNPASLSHFDSLSSISLGNPITISTLAQQHHQHQQQQQQQQHQQQVMKQLMDQTGQYTQNTGGIFIGI